MTSAPAPIRAHLLRIALLALLVCVPLGCGDGGSSTGGGSGTANGAPAAGATTESGDDEGEAVAQPTRAALAIGRRFDALVRAYAPVSARVNFLVAAETLRQAALEERVDADLERERAGAVRVESDRMDQVLRKARPVVRAVPVAGAQQQEVQARMLAAIDARRRALTELNAYLTAAADPAVGDHDRELLRDTWRQSWDESLREARSATTLMQDARAAAGLEPASEESIR